jgi:hypothetical protein
VKPEPTDEFVSAKRHRLVAVAIAIILPAKLNLAVIDIEQAIVGDSALAANGPTCSRTLASLASRASFRSRSTAPRPALTESKTLIR